MVATPTPTTCPVFTPEQWAERLLTLFPGKWSADAARKTGFALHSVFQALGVGYEFIQEQLLYAFNASRIGTATDEALDRVAADFFGNTEFWPATVVRLNGESDSSFRARIIANMFIGAGNRAAITRVFTMLTGAAPRIIEPFSVYDCAALDSASYADIDTIQNPGRIADTGLRASLFIESPLPGFGGQGNNPVYGLDAGAAADFSYCIDPQPTWFQGPFQMDQLLRKTKTLGTNAYRHWMQQAYLTYPVGNTVWVPAGATSIVVNLYPAFSSAYMVLAQASWNAQVSYTPITNSSFRLTFSAPPSVASPVDWLAAPLSVAGFGTVPLNAGASNASLAIPSAFAGAIPIVLPNWNSDAYISSLSASAGTFQFNTTAPGVTNLSYALFDLTRSGSSPVLSGANSVTIPLPPNIPVPFQIFVMPTWNTNCAVVKGTNYFNVTFDTPPIGAGKIYWGIFAPAWWKR